MTTSPASLPLRPTILEVDLEAAAANMRAVRQFVGAQRKIYAVVKADGYGYGAAKVGATFVANGADALAVADLGEGVRLRERGIAAPILVYPNALPYAARDTLAHGLTPTIIDIESAREYSKAAHRSCEVFVQIDVGTERLGVPAEQASDFIMAMLELPHLRLSGLYAHAHSTSDTDYAHWQLGRFNTVVEALEARGVAVPVRLLAASPFIMRFPQTFLGAVDPGRMLYGITYPGEPPVVPLRPVFRKLATRVISIKDVLPRDRFADLAPFPITAPMRVGVIPIGNADGLGWLHTGRMLVRGRAVPVLARPALEHTRVDLTKVADACLGDEVVIIGRQGDAEITIAEVADHHGLRLNQIATSVGPRVSRVYLTGEGLRLP
jgi:alanine racemase